MKSNTFKTYVDYTDQIQKEFPYLSKKEIMIILNYGWNTLYVCNDFGCDILIRSIKYKIWSYIGSLAKDPLKHFKYYKEKLIVKLHYLWFTYKPKWNYEYYISLSYEEYIEFRYNYNKKGRKKKYYTFKNKLAFKTKDACFIHCMGNVYIIKFKVLTDMGFRHFYKELTCEYPQLVLVKESPNTFEDISVENNNYKYEKGSS